ncbi:MULTISPECIES: high light inducible protein [Prochlorococcus]|uniref:Putative high light inducible protein n=1 Tax=Prochlorococcus marinus str. MIT 9116 TaxID=167544 RepID=A0A0A1ZJ38_PROMR|nr:high light inducible protein [Prochlorococcus marinus]KGF89450.1 putative high light inducible protein [Prochlorococcus marinus str. MIT 9116]KGF91548.1 putative high light inducible protein [Prochlorococcus marinus str. MIT 9107]KGF94140.1 putative high light inducible protein [Prochlorococcus marinus str. MIT 9123]
MENQKINIDPQKTKAEKLNGRFAIIGLVALVGAYITTGQIVPGVI